MLIKFWTSFDTYLFAHLPNRCLSDDAKTWRCGQLLEVVEDGTKLGVPRRRWIILQLLRLEAIDFWPRCDSVSECLWGRARWSILSRCLEESIAPWSLRFWSLLVSSNVGVLEHCLKPNRSSVRGAMSWSSMTASVAPRVRVIQQQRSAMVINSFVWVPSPADDTRETTCKSEVTNHGIESTTEAASPAWLAGVRWSRFWVWVLVGVSTVTTDYN